jgi:hypothetical protein
VYSWVQKSSPLNSDYSHIMAQDRRAADAIDRVIGGHEA